MAIKRFGKQVFLNHPNSAASGWVKFNITPDKGCIGFDSTCIIADCTGKIDLEFEPRSLYDSRKDGVYTVKQVTRCYDSIVRRRAKVKKFRDAVNAYADALEAAYDAMEAQLDAIPSDNIIT